MSKENADETESTDSTTNPRDTRWKKFAPVRTSTVKLEPFIFNELEHFVDSSEARIQLHPTDPGAVNIGFTITGEKDGNGVELGGIMQLSPDQADALAEALTDCAESARESE